MRVLAALIVALGLGLFAPGLVPDAAAQTTTYSFSWYSEVFGNDPSSGSFNVRLAGHGTARITVTTTTVVLDFDTPLGPAHAEISRDMGNAQNTRLPFFVPGFMTSDGVGRRMLHGDEYLADYDSNSGLPASPTGFEVRLSQPGSGPQPQFTFVGTGTLQPFTAWMTSPADGATVSGTISVGALGHGGAGITRTFQLYVDSALAQTQQITNGGSATFSLNTTTLSNGSHTVGVNVTDEAGAVAGDARTITVNNATASARVIFFNLTNDQVIRGSYQVQLGTSGLAAGTKRFYISVDGRQVSYWVVTTTGINWWWNTTGYANGTHTLSVRVVDSTGREVTGTVRVIINN